MAWQMMMVPPALDTKALRQRDHEVVAGDWLLSAPERAVVGFAAVSEWKIPRLGVGYQSLAEGGVRRGMVASAELVVQEDLAVLVVVAAAAGQELLQNLQEPAVAEEAAAMLPVLAELGRDVHQPQHLGAATLTGKPASALHLCSLADRWLFVVPATASFYVLGPEQVQHLAGRSSWRRASPQASSCWGADPLWG